MRVEKCKVCNTVLTHALSLFKYCKKLTHLSCTNSICRLCGTPISSLTHKCTQKLCSAVCALNTRLRKLEFQLIALINLFLASLKWPSTELWTHPPVRSISRAAVLIKEQSSGNIHSVVQTLMHCTSTLLCAAHTPALYLYCMYRKKEFVCSSTLCVCERENTRAAAANKWDH